MRSPWLVALMWVSACSPEDLSGFRPLTGDVPTVVESSHTAKVVFGEGSARVEVHRTLRNSGDGWEALTHTVAVPEGAVVVSFRVGTNGQWAPPAALSSAEDVDARWNLLTDPGEAAPATLGKLDWSSDGELQLAMFGIPPFATVELQYVLELPVGYSAGALSFDYPFEEEREGWLAPTFDSSIVDASSSDTEGAVHLRRAWATRDTIDARWAMFPIDTNRTLWRFEVDAAAEFGRVPVQPRVVFVVDASITEGAEGVAGQLELIAPTLANMPDAQVEVIVFRRHAERLFGRFVSASEVAVALSQLAPERLAVGNGSNLDEGARLAAQALRDFSGGPARVFLFTDEQAPERVTVDVLNEAMRELAPDAVVHVVARQEAYGDQLSEDRDDLARFSKAAERRGGVFFRVSGHAGDPLLSANTMLGLVRPVRIDSFVVHADGLEGLTVDDVLTEGSSIRLSAVGDAPPSTVRVTGKLWAKRIEQVISTDTTLSNRLPALAVGDPGLRADLSDDELRTTAFVANAVSPVTSFLAVPPNAAPSTIGFQKLYGGTLGSYSCGCGGSSSRSGCRFGFGTRVVDREALLRALLAPGIAACGATSGATLEVESTRDEVVDVGVEGVEPEVAACLTEVVWAVRLTEEFNTHLTLRFTLN